MTTDITEYNSPEQRDKEFQQLFSLIAARRERASQAVNNEQIMNAWEIGAYVSRRLTAEVWGSKTVTEFAEYLRTRDPSLRGYSRANIYNMVALYDSYTSSDFADYVEKFNLNNFNNEIVQLETGQLKDKGTVQSATAQLPYFLNLTSFTNHIEIINRCKTIEERVFYVLYAYRERLTIKELQRCLKTDVFAVLSGDGHNLSKGLMELYPQSPALFKDTVFVDFLGLPVKHSEKKLKTGIIDHMKEFILELGKDFIFIDQEYPLNVGGNIYNLDLLFFHRALQCLVAVELKAKDFKPSDMGQLVFYLEALDRDVKRSNENPSIGILLCRGANRSVVEYALSRSLSPTMIAEYKRLLLPKEVLRKSLDEFAAFFCAGKEDGDNAD
ncbi:MAG: PDDEXK nuclease domain-containing protein [Oscillospiraceae bacterium]|jgi:predicted nuclease of restriction endonuclease-like (RecB) superfamily|nr:PDDEXK nuclease domain-containing protein [Oscillospiraceae bacterium]